MKKRIWCVIVLCFIYSLTLNAQWRPDGVVVVDTSTQTEQYIPLAVTDGKGGCFVVWDDYQRRMDRDIYIQRINSDGYAMFEKNGKLVVDAPRQQLRNDIVADGQGGLFVTWYDTRSDEYIFAQHFDSNGTSLWQANGIKVAERGGLGNLVELDGQGGIIMLWTQVYGIVTQRLNNMGQRMWGDSGIYMSNYNVGLDIGYWDITGDGKGGAIATWSERISPPSIETASVFSQRIRADGTFAWGPNGVHVFQKDTCLGPVSITADKQGGCIITWTIASNTGVFAQRIDSNGTLLWGSNGVYIGYGGTGVNPLVSDEKDGSIIPVGNRFYRIRSDGTQAWPGGVQFAASFDVECPKSDGASGVFILYLAKTDSTSSELFAQHIDSSGVLSWNFGGVLLCSYSCFKQRQIAIADGKGGIIGVWNDWRNSSSSIYAGKIDSDGVITLVDHEYSQKTPPRKTTLLQNYPNPFNPSTVISYQLSEKSFITLKMFDMTGKEITTLLNDWQMSGSHSIQWNGTDNKGNRVSSGIYFYQLSTSSGTITKKAVYLK